MYLMRFRAKEHINPGFPTKRAYQINLGFEIENWWEVKKEVELIKGLN